MYRERERERDAVRGCLHMTSSRVSHKRRATYTRLDYTILD